MENENESWAVSFWDQLEAQGCAYLRVLTLGQSDTARAAPACPQSGSRGRGDHTGSSFSSVFTRRSWGQTSDSCPAVTGLLGVAM